MSADCTVCDAHMQLAVDLCESEVVTCGECKSNLVVDKIVGSTVNLSQAPAVEEDWGE